MGEKLTSRVVGVSVLAAASATILPTLADPVYRTKTHESSSSSIIIFLEVALTMPPRFFQQSLSLLDLPKHHSIPLWVEILRQEVGHEGRRSR